MKEEYKKVGILFRKQIRFGRRINRNISRKYLFKKVQII